MTGNIPPAGMAEPAKSEPEVIGTILSAPERSIQTNINEFCTIDSGWVGITLSLKQNRMNMIKSLTFFAILLLGSSGAVKGQLLSHKAGISLPATAAILMPYQKGFTAVISSDLRTTRPAFVHLSLSKWHSGNSAALAPTPVAPDYYYNHCYGIFCKMEWIAQNQWHIPVTFRLGTYHYERSLEGEE